MKKKKVIAKVKSKTKTSKKVLVKSAKPKLTVKRSPSVAPRAEKKKYEVSLYFSPTHKFNAKGDTVIECLNQITPEFPTLKAKGIFTVSSGKLKSEKVMYPFAIKRLLSGSVSKIIFEKNMVAVMR